MNKQELIDELKRISLEKQHKALTHPESKNYYEGMVMAYSQVVHMVNTVLKLDEPKKPVVPQFVADWFEEHKRDLDYNIWEYIREWGQQDRFSDFHQWFDKEPNNPIEILIRMKDGYEVEKEQLYYVRLPFEVWDEEAAELKTEYLYLHYEITSDETRIFPTKEPRKGFVAKLDELTIKSADENYWPFAVPVEEEAEG
ncbi:TPA: DUF1642 domain-containing protein [Enterococcus faecium]|uniref:DUF1642 domain-containing protein n=1 Tax=Enterococcus sp. E4-85 TaxID=2996021 RepID=UPI002D807927|nr:DUF1642 domain-containing protein [Enterococcus sp. E4-85]MEB4597745.1 DUF1642 domain-containing protein [Enterococcus sp. E4-85]